MTLVFTEQFDALIWKIMEATNVSALGLELRSEQDLNVQYRVLDLKSFDQVIYENEALDWWTGLQGVDADKVWIKKFEDESDPSVFVWWSMDRISGELFEESAPQHLMHDEPVGNFPAVYHPGMDAYEKVQTFLRKRTIEVTDPLEYLETDDFICIAYYLRKNKQLSRHVYVMDNKGALLMNRQLDENMQGVVFQSFFTYQNLFIFVENRNELHVYKF